MFFLAFPFRFVLSPLQAHCTRFSRDEEGTTFLTKAFSDGRSNFCWKAVGIEQRREQKYLFYA